MYIRHLFPYAGSYKTILEGEIVREQSRLNEGGIILPSVTNVIIAGKLVATLVASKYKDISIFLPSFFLISLPSLEFTIFLH